MTAFVSPIGRLVTLCIFETGKISAVVEFKAVNDNELPLTIKSGFRFVVPKVAGAFSSSVD
ncbi:hypothetical protein [Flavobacterium sp. 3HN19-14]|uniref:hypothetical protein n=1 Tax=Flavobacterium sp. 3HN19-14 TaxID=3448133 RepID=UPI003EE23DA2